MSKQGTRLVGARLLGIYFLVYGLASVPTALATYSIQVASDGVEAQFGQAFALASITQALILMAAGVLLTLWKGKASPKEVALDPVRMLWVGLKLLAVYFVVTGASDIVWGAMRGSVDGTIRGYSKAISGALVVAAGLVLWFVANRLSGLPNREGKAA
jgi:hypothetical protein